MESVFSGIINSSLLFAWAGGICWKWEWSSINNNQNCIKQKEKGVAFYKKYILPRVGKDERSFVPDDGLLTWKGCYLCQLIETGIKYFSRQQFSNG